MSQTWSTTYDILNKKRKKNKSFPEVFKDNGDSISDKIEIVNKFNLYFINIGVYLASKMESPVNKSFTDNLKTKHNTVLEFHEVKYDAVKKNRQSQTKNKLWLGLCVW